MHNHRFLRVGDQAEVFAGGGEEVNAALHVHFRCGVEGAVVGEEFMDRSCGYRRPEMRPPRIEVAVRPAGDADPGAFVTVSVQQHGREHETEEGRRENSALIHSVGHCDCLSDSSIIRDARHHAIVELTHHLSEMLWTVEFQHNFPLSFAIHRVKCFFQINECRIEVDPRLLTLLLQLAAEKIISAVL
ncbi:Peptidyl-prolyl isomerase cwc27 [Sparganum proliferum]